MPAQYLAATAGSRDGVARRRQIDGSGGLSERYPTKAVLVRATTCPAIFWLSVVRIERLGRLQAAAARSTLVS
jgi:hypothetical protein